MNYYKMSRDKYDNLGTVNVTKTYKNTNREKVQSINRETKPTADDIKLTNCIKQLAQKEFYKSKRSQTEF